MDCSYRDGPTSLSGISMLYQNVSYLISVSAINARPRNVLCNRSRLLENYRNLNLADYVEVMSFL